MVDAPGILEGREMASEEEGDGLLHRHVEVVAFPSRPCGAARG